MHAVKLKVYIQPHLTIQRREKDCIEELLLIEWSLLYIWWAIVTNLLII